MCPKSDRIARGRGGARGGARRRGRLEAVRGAAARSPAERRSLPVSNVPPLTPQSCSRLFAALGIAAETVEHEAVFTVAESRRVKARIPAPIPRTCS